MYELGLPLPPTAGFAQAERILQRWTRLPLRKAVEAWAANTQERRARTRRARAILARWVHRGVSPPPAACPARTIVR